MSARVDSYYVDIDAKYLNEWHDYIKESVRIKSVIDEILMLRHASS